MKTRLIFIALTLPLAACVQDDDAYPNINIVPTAETAQLTPDEQRAIGRNLDQAKRNSEAGRGNLASSKATAADLSRTAKSHSAQTLKKIEQASQAEAGAATN